MIVYRSGNVRLSRLEIASLAEPFLFAETLYVERNGD